MIKYLDMVNVKGIIQVGANTGQEVPIFEKYCQNVILVEPLQEPLLHLYNLLHLKNLQYIVIESALGIEDEEKDFYLASNGESSSLLKPNKHLVFYPTITFNDTMKVKVQRFDTLVEKLKIDMNDYNVVVTDTQGCDLDVLKGFGNLINNIDLIISEYINTELYEGNQGLTLFKEYLKDFELIETCDENNGAGNAIFKRITNV